MINSQLGGTQKLTEEGTQKRTGGDTETHSGGHRNAQFCCTDEQTDRHTDTQKDVHIEVVPT